MDKKEIRSQIKSLKKRLSVQERERASEEICQRAFDEIKDKHATNVALFLSLPDEVDTTKLITLLSQQGKHTLLIPRVEDETTIRFYRLNLNNDLEVSHYGILEPTDDVSAELVPTIMIVPGVAFDRFGGRIGRGKGYYDRYFAKHKTTIQEKIAIGYQLQVFSDSIPMDLHDEPMDVLITEKETLRIAPHK